MEGRRRPDTPLSCMPDDVQAGDYWKILQRESGEPLVSTSPSNLTGTCWMVAAPLGDDGGFGVGRLMHHTVRENEDGTITVAPNDGSSNSIKITGSHDRTWHGYIERGVWREA